MARTSRTDLDSAGESPAGDDTGAGTFRVIARAMDILKCLSKHPSGLTLTEVSREAKLHKATTARFLKALAEGGFAAQGSTGKMWKLGPTIVEISARAVDNTDIRLLARPIMEEASRATNETVQLAILADDAVVYVDKVEPYNLALKINTEIGSRRPVHCTALGKVLAAHLDPADIDRLLARLDLSRKTARTITEPDRLRAELARVRLEGIAVDDHEYNELVICAAAPVRDASGRVVAGLSISTFGIQSDSARFRDLKAAAVAAAIRVSAAMGWSAAEHSGHMRHVG